MEALQPLLALGRRGPIPGKPSSEGHLLPTPLDTGSANPLHFSSARGAENQHPSLHGHQRLFPAGVPKHGLRVAMGPWVVLVLSYK